MKKLALLVSVVILSLTLNSCKKDNPVDCTKLATDYSNAAAAYATDQSTENCIALKNAINDYLDSDCAILTTALRASLESELQELSCN